MHNIYKYLAMAMLVCLTVWHLPILGAKPRMVCPDGKRPYFGVCPGGEEPIPSDDAASEARNHSRPQPESKPQVDVRPVGHIDSADGCNASRRPGGGNSDCPPKKVVTPTVVTTTPTAALIAGRYQDNRDGTVTDVTTNLMWKQCSEGLTWVSGTCSGYNAVEITSNEAMPNSQQKIWLNFYGYDDWRVPAIKELDTLVYCSSGAPKNWNNTGDECTGAYQRPTIYASVFPNTPAKCFWSSSVSTSNADYVWAIDFYYGSNRGINVNDGCSLRLVRKVTSH